MFGYITPIKSELLCSDYMLYRSFYCGLCKTIGKFYGQMPRFTTNYDVTFLSVLLTSYTGEELEFKNSVCVLSPFKKKQCVQKSELLNKVSAANIMLSYYKAIDGVIDKDGSTKAKIAKKILKKAYKKVNKQNPELEKIICEGYTKLRLLEQKNCASIDRVADCFAVLLKEVTINLLGLGESELNSHQDILALCYNIGKFVYLVDALDDLQDDYKKHRYNPFLAEHPEFSTRQEFIKKHLDDLNFIFAVCVNRAIESYNNMAHKLDFGTGLLQNILYKGLRAKVDELLASDKKLKKPVF